MKRLFITCALLGTMLTNLFSASLTPGTEYYLWLNIYEKLLGQDKAGSAPALSAYGQNADASSYVFIAEDCGKDGYVLLRQKSSGRYFAASSSSNWSTVFEETRSTDDRFCWKVDVGTYSYLVNKKNSKYLGVDGANKEKDYVSVWYDKPKGSHSQFSVIPVEGETWDEARQAYTSEVYTNAQNIKEIDYCLVKNQIIDRSDAIDIHITANTSPIQGTTTNTKINLGSDRTWLILDNILPTEVISSYLKYVTINGKKASNGSNCRVAIYLNGAAVIPTPSAPMICQSTMGEFTLSATNHSNLSKKANTITSFTLRRGYMATVASGTSGSGYSRVFVADHADLEIELPMALAKRVSSVNIKPWPYLSKKGMGNKKGSSGIDKLRANWFWTWSAGYDSGTNYEFVPCLQHRYWPSASDVNSKTATASISLNEPEHSEQHTNCSCGGTTDEWTAYTFNSKFLPSGGRIGSPQPTDLGYLTNFFQHVDNMASRCDFAVTHSYWDLAGMDETAYANWYCDTKCKSVWTNTGRPLWISEFNISASWNDNNITSYEQHRKYMQVLLQKIEECPWIERYAVYLEDKWETYMFYENNPEKGLTPAGQVYRDHRSTFAYNAKYTKVPTWWAPAAKTPSLHVKQSESTKLLTFIIQNPNTDMTDQMLIERKNADGTWSTFHEVTDRYRFDTETVTVSGIDPQDANLETDQFCVTIITLNGKTVNSSSADAGYIINPNVETSSKSSVEGWTCSRDADNGYTKSTGDTYFEVWNPTASAISFNYYQDIQDLKDGVYQLSANVFNSADNVEGDAVNGAVVLYAQTSSQLYVTPITEETPVASDALDISEYPLIEVKNIVVTDGKLRVGVRNLGTMGARWAGADNFQLIYVGKLNTINQRTAGIENDLSLYALMPAIIGDDTDPSLLTPYSTPRDASAFIVNPEANRKTNYGWEASNVDFMTNNESYDANKDNTYWNLWKGSAFTSSLTQDITGLPAGKYTFSAILRGSTAATMTLSATVKTKTVTQSVTGTGTTSPEGSPYPNGWQLVTTDPIMVDNGQTLNLSFSMTSSGGAWWSADHFGLTLVEVPESRTAITTPSTETTPQSSVIYDLTGRRVHRTASNNHINRGIYIINGRKVLVK